ncbi:MAG: DUF4065 domain-containing protein [Clostridia bacterium]|nr:DUF4065 domain-containing protein [Clostridia bacterium]
MTTHFIFMSSSYHLGTRIALDYIVTDFNAQENLKRNLDKIVDECGKDVSISTHMLQTNDETWKSVQEADYFFKDVKLIKTVEEFIKLIQRDRKLEGIDIAKYILSKIKCTQLKLQKLLYICFADYMCNTGKKLFTDRIVAYKYGPVVEDVYKKYRKYGYKLIEEAKDIESDSKYEMPSKSRILFAEDGTEKIISIEKTLTKYGNLSASELVELTHRENTPWDRTYKGTFFLNPVIENDIIKAYHKFEQI